MKNQLDRIEKKLDWMDSRQDEMMLTLSQNTKDVAEHIRRTDLLEKKLLKITYALVFVAGVAVSSRTEIVKHLLGIIL